jgi:hypothetical protein
MRRTLLFVSISLAAAGGTLSACGGDDSKGGQTADSGADTTNPQGDSGNPHQDGNAADTNAADTSVADTNAADTSVQDTSVADTSVADTGTPDTGGDAGCVVLTVKNYLSWCSVSVAGGAASTSPVQTACVTPGMITVAASPASAAFILGPTPWHDTSGDTGSGDPGTVAGMTSTTTAVVGAMAKCVWACCPFPNGMGCPTTDQCP